MRKLQIIIILLLLFPAFCFATTYYVRPNGHDSCDGLADVDDARPASCAKLTINGAHALTVADDIVYIRDGTYNNTVTISRSGSSGHPITYYGSSTSTWISKKITISANYIVMDTFRYGDPTIVLNSGIPQISITGNYNTINNVLYNPAGAGGQMVNLSGTASNNTFSNFTATNMNFETLIITGENTASNTFKDGYVHDTIDIDFVHPWGTNNVFQDIEITSNVRVDTVNQHCDIAQIFGAVSFTVSNGIIFQRLYVHDSDTNIMYSNGGNAYTIQNWIWRNNIFVNLTGEQRVSIPYVYLYNNVYYNTGTANDWTIQIGGNQAGGEYDNTGLEIKNNVFVSNNTKIWAENGSGYASYTHNNNYYGTLAYAANAYYVTGGSLTAITEATMVNGGDPVFTTAGTNFHIGSTSVLKDVGATISSFSTDKDNANRPQGSAWDIGPYEYATVSVTSSDSTIASQNVTYSIAGAPSNYTVQSVVSFKATGVAGTANISITYPGLPVSPVFYKVVSGVWKQIYPTNECFGMTSITLAGNTLSFILGDNSVCDSNATVGTIEDPVVVGTVSSGGSSGSSISSSASDSGSGGCFIATAAYGTDMAEEILILKNFRDGILLNTTYGKILVNFYYRVSPPLADFIRSHEILRTATRIALTPIVFAIKYPYVFGILFPAGIIVIIRRKKKTVAPEG